MKCLWSSWREVGFKLLDLGSSLIRPLVRENHYWLLESVVHDLRLYADKKIQLKQTDDKTLSELVKQQIGVDAWCWDRRFWYASLTDFKTMVSEDFTNRLTWLAESFDCDNFASLFCSLLSLVWGYNGVGVALGAVLDKGSKNVVGYHAYNCVLVEEDSKRVLCLYEPQSDFLALAERETNMDWSIYRTDLVLFY